MIHLWILLIHSNIWKRTKNFLLVLVHKIVEDPYLPMHLAQEMTHFLLVLGPWIVLETVIHHQYLLIDRDRVIVEGHYLPMPQDLVTILIALDRITGIPMMMPIGHKQTRILIRSILLTIPILADGIALVLTMKIHLLLHGVEWNVPPIVIENDD